MIERFFDAITRLSLRFRWITVVLALLVLAGGVVAAGGLNLELLPRVEFPQTIIVAQWPDAESAEQLLTEVTIPLEEGLSAVDGVVNVESTTQASFAFIIARSEFGLNQDRLLADIEEAVADTALPAGMETPQILNFSLSDLPVVVASISSPDLSLPELKALVEADLQPQLAGLAQVSEVTVSGGQELPENGDVEEADEPAATVTPEATPLPTATATATATPDPAQLPETLVQAAAAGGMELETADDLTPELMRQITAFPQGALFLQMLTEDNLRSLPPESIALLPADFVDGLGGELRADLDDLAADFGGAGALALAEAEPTPGAQDGEEVPQVEPVALPESWIAAGETVSATLETTADVTAPVMQGIVGFAPALLADLEPPMWRALAPEALALALPAAQESLDPALGAQLEAIIAAGTDADVEAIALPDAWVAASQGMGITLETTDDVTPEVITGMAAAAPEALQALTPEMLLALDPATLAALPEEYVEGLDGGLQETIGIIVIRGEQFAAEQGETGDEATATPPAPTATPDPAQLPDVLVQGAAAAGITLETAADFTPELMRQITAFPQGAQFLQLLSEDNLRALPAESIALLPPDFADGLDAELREELDELAADYGGAGELARQEAEEAEAAAAGAPDLTGIWIEPNEDGEVQFETAADILNNPFAPSAAEFLNFVPNFGVDDPSRFMADLTPNVVAYLADNEDGFAAGLSPTVLEWMSPESLSYLLENYPDAFAPDLAERLREIAAGEVEAFIPEASITRTDGDPSVILSVFKAGDANTVEVAHEVFDALDAFSATHSDGTDAVNTTLVFEQATFIEDSIEGVSREGILGAFFAIIIILVFLSGRVGNRFILSWRSTAVTAVSIPLSVFAALLLMRWVPPTVGVWLQDLAQNGDNQLLTFISRLFPESVTLNIMTLSGLTVAVGRVVDDSIVVLENIYRYIQTGEDPKQSVIAGTREVAIAIFSSTVATVSVFLPLGLIGGLIGSFFLPFGLTVTYALASSFVVAITVVPALAYILIRSEHLPEERETALQRWYTPILEWALTHRFLTLLLAFVLFVGSLFLLGQLPQSFIPALGEPTINVGVELDPGTSMLETNEAVAAFEDELATLDGIEKVQTEIGSGGGFEAFFGGGGVSQNVANLTVSVEDQDGLALLTNEIRDLAEASFGEENVTVSAASQAGFGGFSLTVTGDSLDQLAEIVPDIEAALASVDLDGDGRADITNISSNLEATAVGDEGETFVRIDGRPAISFGGELETENTLGVTSEAKAVVQELDSLPEDVTVSEGFDSEQQVEGFRSMVTAIGYSIILVYLIMALTFRSLIHPFTILFSLPFALVGAAAALYLTGSVLGISAMIGLMMLVGIVVTNAIVLMELVQQLRAQGVPAYDALVQAGRTRLRPIWMTALTAVLALIPLAVSSESGAVIASELARAVIGGLLVSTALTLLVVPVVYSLFEQLSVRLRRKPAA